MRECRAGRTTNQAHMNMHVSSKQKKKEEEEKKKGELEPGCIHRECHENSLDLGTHKIEFTRPSSLVAKSNSDLWSWIYYKGTALQWPLSKLLRQKVVTSFHFWNNSTTVLWGCRQGAHGFVYKLKFLQTDARCDGDQKTSLMSENQMRINHSV